MAAESKNKLFLISFEHEVIKAFDNIEELKAYLAARRLHSIEAIEGDWALISGVEWQLDEKLVWVKPPDLEPILLTEPSSPRWRKKLDELEEE